jgi:hypothetical protein
MLINICIANIKSPSYIKQISIDLKGEMDSNTITGRIFNIPLSIIDWISRKKINEEIAD